MTSLLESRPHPTDAAAWTADGAAAVSLARLRGPASGSIEPPRHLLDTTAAAGTPWNLDRTTTKISLYELCLTRGGAFDIYRCVNLEELARLWPQLRLPAGLRAHWTAALRAGGLLPGVVAEWAGPTPSLGPTHVRPNELTDPAVTHGAQSEARKPQNSPCVTA